MTGTHPVLPGFPVRVAPTVAGEFNRLVPALAPIACWLVEDARFKFDSSFVGPEIAVELAELSALRTGHSLVAGAGAAAYPRVSIFGHADPTGDDVYNKTLSGRRATAIYALLTRDTAKWEQLYATRIKGTGDDWGLRTVQTMLDTLGFDPGAADGEAGGRTKAALSRFQAAHGLATDGAANAAVRAALFLDYMNKLCGDLKLDKEDDFLAGSPGDMKGDAQGCGEFNPVMVFSRTETAFYARAENKLARDGENACNRRVMLLLFPPGVRVESGRWPCPTVAEGVGGCRARFWSDGETRRAPQDERRTTGAFGTFACRFYDRLASQSPCNALRRTLTLWLHDAYGRLMPAGTPYRLDVGGQIRTGALAQDGLLSEPGLVFAAEAALVEWGRPTIRRTPPELTAQEEKLRQRLTGGDPTHPYLVGSKLDPTGDNFIYRDVVSLDLPNSVVAAPPVVKLRLDNLGYLPEVDLHDNLDQLAEDYELSLAPDATLEQTLVDIHRFGTERPLVTFPDPPPRDPTEDLEVHLDY